MKIFLIACHDAQSSRKIDFHFWADILADQGHRVYFITVGFSRISDIKKDTRRPARPYNQWLKIGTNYTKFSWMPYFHPCLNGLAKNRVVRKVFSLYPYQFPRSALAELKNADLFIVESGAGLMLVPRLAKYCTNAKFLYSVSDRLKTLDAHPAILQGEADALPHFDAIRVPAAVMKNDFTPGLPVHHINPGLHKSLFDHASDTPYTSPRNVVSVGDMLFDAKSIEIMAEHFPLWSFHLFGKGAKLTKKLPNVIEYGERPFFELVPYIQYADIGLAPYKTAPSADYLSQSSLKMIQYTYCRLPILAPHFSATGRPHVMLYREGDRHSIIEAFKQAIIYDRKQIDRSQVLSWEEMIGRMLALITNKKYA